jgi:hypothetical protein
MSEIERYNLEKAQEEADRIRKKAQEAKAQRGETGELESQDYGNAEKIIAKADSSKSIPLPISIKELISNPIIQEMKDDFRKLQNPYFKQMHGEKDINPERYKELEKLSAQWDKETYLKIEDEIEKKYSHNLETLEFILQWEILKQAGIDPENLEKMKEDMIKTLGPDSSFGVKNSFYLTLIALASKFLEYNLKDRIIVEIGPGSEGNIALAYFAAKGAHAIGIDPNPKPDKRTEEHGVELVSNYWENIGEILHGRKADIIYFHHMTPNVDVASGKFRAGEAEKYNNFVIEEMNKVLVENGVIIQHNIDVDFRLVGRSLQKLGYTSTTFGEPQRDYRKREDPAIIETFNNLRRGKTVFYRLTVWQKPKGESEQN